MYDMANLKKLPAQGKLAPEASKAYQAFDQAALADGVVPKKYKELMAVAVALTTQCPYCIEVHKDAAVKRALRKPNWPKRPSSPPRCARARRLCTGPICSNEASDHAAG